MISENSLPSNAMAGEESRSVYSPAAYLADLLKLVGAGEELSGRRPGLAGVAAAEDGHTELPYLDIVNEVLARELEPDTGGRPSSAELLATRLHPLQLPYSMPHERIRGYLRHLGVEPAELYRRFAATIDPDVVAREFLGLTPDDVALVTTPLAGDGRLRAAYGIDDVATLADVAVLQRALGVSDAELRTLLHGAGVPVTPDAAGPPPVAWLDRANRFVRLARRLDLSLADLDLVLRTCCDRLLDHRAVRVLAVVMHLHRTLDLPVDVVVSLVGPINALGSGDADTPADLFNRVFNVPFVAREGTVLRTPASDFPGYAALPALTPSGDVLAPVNAGWRRRVAAALHIDEKSLTTIIRRYQARSAGTGPFGPDAEPYRMLGLLHRITRLAASLELSPGELLDIVEAVQLDPAIALPILIDTEVAGGDAYAILADGDPETALWLVQTVVALAGWLRSANLTGAGLCAVVGGGARSAGTAALRERLRAHLGDHAELLAVLQQEFATPAIEAICVGVAGSLPGAVQVLTGPAGAAELAARRIRGLARFAAALGLSPAEVTYAFREWNLAGRFGEPLELPPGVDRIDAVLERADGSGYLFYGRSYWTFTAASRALTAGPAAIEALSVRFAPLTAVDAAFVDADGTEWLVGRDADGRSHSFTRAAGQPEFLPRPQTWGVVRNAFADPAHIDAAFTDEQGHTYLFAGDQYVRYSTTDHTVVDEGFPRAIGDWRPGQLPPRFRSSLDAVFHGLDGRIHLFSGDRVLSLGEPGDALERPLAETWGHVANALSGASRVDAGYADGPAVLLFAGNQVFRYTDNIENDGVRVDEGHPRRIESVFGGLPAGFADGVQAAFRDAAGTVHLFQNGRTVALSPDGASEAATAERWGRLGPALPGGTVDAVMVGRDGRTYLFSGTHYLRYTGSDYAAADVGYPRVIAEDWAGLARVDQAFVLDGRTYLFGAGQAVRYSTADYTRADSGYPQPISENWWNLPEHLLESFRQVDAVFVAQDGRVHLFAGDEFITQDTRRRRWSQPQALKERWDSLPFDKVDAAFAGADARTYVFSGNRYARYSDPGATRIDDHYPAMIDQFWGTVVSAITRNGQVDAALVAGEHTYLFSGDQFVRYTGTAYDTVDLGYPRRLSQLSAEPAFAGLTAPPAGVDAAFADRGTIYLISGRQIHAVSAAAYRRYADLAVDEVRTAYLDGGGVRVEHPDGWRHYSALEGPEVSVQPDRPRALRTAPAEFRSELDAVLTSADGNVYLFKGESCFDTRLGRAVAHRRIDAAVLAGGHTYLFTGDQYVRCAAADHRLADPGYPRPIIGNLRTEPGFTNLPAAFDAEIAERYATGGSMIDAALAGERTVYLFVGRTCHAVSGAVTATYPLDRLGRIRNTIAERGRVDAALVRGPHTYLFSGDQFVRYTGGDYRLVDDGHPRPLTDFTLAGLPPDGIDAVLAAPDGELYVFAGREYRRGRGPSSAIAGTWGRVANEFDGGRPLDAAFVAGDGELYAFCGSQFVRYAADSTLDTVDPGYPLRISGRWGDLPPEFEAGIDGAFRLHDRIYLQRAGEVVRLGAGSGPLTFPQLFPPSADYRIADLRAIQRHTELTRTEPGWDEQELSWARGIGADPLRTADMFALAERLGVGPSTVHAGIWERVHGPAPDREAAATLLAALIGDARPAADRRLNLRTRDALVAAVLAESGLRHPRELSDRFLIDVEAGSEAMTSRVREAIAAVQLYLQRCLLGHDGDGELRERVRAAWPAMRSYREWAAGRERLLCPENHLRPQLRPDKTPAFEALERDLLDGSPDDAAIQQAYRRYLDEYTEVSRLIVAGGFVDAAGARRMVLFGRGRTEPRRYHYRQAELGEPAIRWSAWLPVDVPIGADRVHPVLAFGRLFVFWAVPEPQQVRLRYSYQELDGGWVPAQTLGTVARQDGSTDAVHLLVRPQTDAIRVSCSGTQFTLHPELYVDVAPTDYAAEPAAVAEIFLDPAEAVPFDVPDGAGSLPWFSADVRGGSFLCRPAVVPEPEDAPLLPLRGNTDRLPAWNRVDAAFEVPGGDRYFFDNQRGAFAVVPPGGRMSAMRPISGRFGRLPSALPVPGPVDAVLTRAEFTYVVVGDSCLRYTGQPFGQVDAGYPRPLEQVAAAEGLPAWPRIDWAFTDVRGIEWFGQEHAGLVAGAADLGQPIPMDEFVRRLGLGPDFGPIVTVLVAGPITYVIGETRYVRYNDRRARGDWWEGREAGYPRPLRENADGLPDDRIISEALWRQDTFHYIDNHNGTVLTVAPDGSRSTRPLHATSEMAQASRVDAAWLVDDRLYLTCGREFHRYTLGADRTIPDFPDQGYPRQMPRTVSAAFRRGDQLYLFSGSRYCRVPAGQEPGTLPTSRPVAGAWAELPQPSGTPFDAALDSADGLFLFVRDSYCRHAKDLAVPRPYELAALPFQLIRLTSGTAAGLNHTLLTGGLPALLSRATQQRGEPPVSTDALRTEAIRVRASMVDPDSLPGGPGLDFRGADGSYYWEIFGHLPLLVAQRLQAVQRFAEARRWYEYVFDPADPEMVWQLLPLLHPDPPGDRARLLTAYRKAVVLGYLDNLLEWADVLFKEHTRDSLAEARLLYLLAQDLLGAGLLDAATADQELLDELTGGILTVPENQVLAGFRSRVADRLHELRES